MYTLDSLSAERTEETGEDMAAVLISFLFSPFFYGVEFFLASTLTTQIALSFATIAVSTVTIFLCQRVFYQWYEDSTEFIIRIKNKVGLGERHVAFTAKTIRHDDQDRTEGDDSPLETLSQPLPYDDDVNSEEGKNTTVSAEKSTGKDKPSVPMDSWLQKQTVAMHRSHWVAKPGRIAPTTFIGIGRRGSADNSSTLYSGKGPPWAPGSEGISEQRMKLTLDRRQSSPSSLSSPRTKITQSTAEPAGQEDQGNTGSKSTFLQEQATPSGTVTASSDVTEDSEQRSMSASEDVSYDDHDKPPVEEVVLAQDERPLERLIPTETEVKEAILVDSVSFETTPSDQANIKVVPEDSSESDRASHSQTSEERSSGHTDTDSLATDDIFSDSELDDSKKSDDVFVHDDAEKLPGREPPIDISVDSSKRNEPLLEGTRPDIVVCEADTTIPVTTEITEADPDSSVSLSVERGPIPRKDSFGLLPVLKGRVHHVKIETTTYTGPVTAISVEETKSESDNEVAGILSNVKSGSTHKNGTDDGKHRPYPPSPQKQDSLGVPPVVTGEVSFPGARPKNLEAEKTIPKKGPLGKVSKVDSLEVPPILKLEDRLPPTSVDMGKSKKQDEKSDFVQEIRVRLPPRTTHSRRGRPSSLDIPTLNVSESCPPRQNPRDKAVSLNSSLSSRPIVRNSYKISKQGPSILKRSGSVDRSGPKKSVTFSPIVIPWGGSSEEGIEPSRGSPDHKRPSSQFTPVRPKVFRYNSVDVPETARRRQKTEFIRQLGMPGELSDEDQESWEQGKFARFYRKSNQRDDKLGTSSNNSTGEKDRSQPLDSIEVSETELSPRWSGAIKKSAKERFLEAGGARAVMSVLVTQDSTDRGPMSPSSFADSKESPMDSNQDLERTTSWAKSRFLRSGESNMKASRLFVDRVRGSMDLSESHSEHSSPSDNNDDTSSSSDQQFEETEEGGIRSTTAKSRFLLSCREQTHGPLASSGSVPVDRLFGWEPVPLSLPEVPEADEAEDEHISGSRKVDVKGKDASVDLSAQKNISKDDIDSPESSGVHSMEPDESMNERILSLDSDSQTKHVPSKSSTTSSHSYHRHLKTAIVMDNGSQFLKVGLIDEKKPSIELPNVISRDKVESFNHRFIGLEAVKNCTISPFEYPITGGHVKNWDDVESIWRHIFDAKLGLTPQEHPLLMTEIATVPKHQRERTMEIFFETFNIPSLFFANQASLSLRATGTSTGLALSSGSGVTEVVPVYNGVTLSRAVTKLDLGGRSATKYLAHLIEKDTGHRLMSSPGAMEVLRELKEDQTFVNKGPAITKTPSDDDYDDIPWHCWLPDGSTVEVNREHVQTCAEPLFQPALAGILHQPGMPNLVADCLDRCDQDVLSEFPSSLLLCGGNTYLGGFTERLQSELNTLGLGYITVEAPKGRDLLPWIGGALLASQLDSEDQWISLDDYLEHGACYVHKRCT